MSSEKSVLDVFIDTKRPIMDISSRKLVVSHEKDRLRDILSLMLTDKYRKIPIVDKDNNLRGIVTSTDVIDLLGGGEKHNIFKKNNKDEEIAAEKFMTMHIKAIRPETNIKKSMEAFGKGERGLYPIVKSGRLVSVVSEWDFVKLVSKPLGMKVYEAMVEKPMIVKNKYSVYDVAKTICRGGYRRLPVVRDNILMGVVTPYDILLHVRRSGTEKNFPSDKTRIETVMNREPVIIEDDADLFSAINAMRSKRVGGLFVVEDDELVGILTERDILEVLL